MISVTAFREPWRQIKRIAVKVNLRKKIPYQFKPPLLVVIPVRQRMVVLVRE